LVKEFRFSIHLFVPFVVFVDYALYRLFDSNFHAFHRHLDTGSHNPVARVQSLFHQDTIRLVAQHLKMAEVQA